ncbi:MAG: hypothetical protein KC912_02015 [Proteobacteria bacterium]|nr:hypothetical protein [Pseudomonadota bacterium]
MRHLLPAVLLLAACPEPKPPCDAHEDCLSTEFCVEQDFCLSVFDRTYDVAVVNATVASLSPTLGPWDPEDETGPDILALYGSTAENGDICVTSTLMDTTEGTWDESCELTLVAGESFAIELYDEDVDDQFTFLGGWIWEDDASIVNLVRQLGEVQRIESPPYSAEFRFDPPR